MFCTNRETDKLFPTYRSLEEATSQDMIRSTSIFEEVSSPEAQSDRLVQLYQQLKGVNIGCQIDLYEHGLQTATKAFRDGADEETVVVCLLHDIGELLSPVSHGEIAAGILRPYISPKNYWILMHHEIFQAYYYGEAAGIDKDLRERFRNEEYFDDCERFCRDWDQASFDPSYESEPIEFFVPMIRRLLSNAPYSRKGQLRSKLCAAKKGLSNAYPGRSVGA